MAHDAVSSMADGWAHPTPYPVHVTVQPKLEQRNRLTVAFRPILAIPHAILAGPIYWSSSTGLLAAAAYVMAIVSWFTLLFGDRHLPEIRSFCVFYLRWRTRAVTYMALFRDEYPPFGENPYPAVVDIVPPTGARDRLSIALRLVFALPHLLVVALLGIGWFVTTVIAWFAILMTGKYPAALYPFGIGVLRWAVRLEAYMLLLVDEFPPFSLDEPAA
jgi:hypothetical protein